MRRHRSFRLITVCLALFSMLFMQLAVAAYACPAAAVMQHGEMTQMDESASATMHCDGMDHDQTSLCHLHAYGDQVRQSADNPHLPVVQPFFPASLLLALRFAHTDAAGSTRATDAVSLAHGSAPPLTIRHCCLRI